MLNKSLDIFFEKITFYKRLLVTLPGETKKHPNHWEIKKRVFVHNKFFSLSHLKLIKFIKNYYFE